MELGVSLGLSPREDVDHVVRVLRSAEDQGISTAWIIDSQLAMKDAYLTLAVLARETASITLGPGVTNLVTRHETVVANAMATLASLAPGRIVVGLGAGDSAVFPIGAKPLSIRRCHEGLERLRSMLKGGGVDGSAGEMRLSFAPQPPPPIYLAGSQPRMLELAGKVADGVIVMGPADPDMVRTQFDHIDRGLRSARRPASSLVRDLWVTMAVGDRESATADVRSWATAQARWLTTWSDVPPTLEPFREEMDRARRDYEFGSHLARRAAHAGDVSDRFARALAIAGTADDCVPRLSALTALGPDRITVTLLSGGRELRVRQTLEVFREATAVSRVQ